MIEATVNLPHLVKRIAIKTKQSYLKLQEAAAIDTPSKKV